MKLKTKHFNRWILFSPFLVSLLLYPAKNLSGQNEVRDGARLQSLYHSVPYVPGEVIVRFKDGATSQLRAWAHQRFPPKSVTGLRSLQMELVQLEEGENVEEAVARYRALPEVDFAQPNYIYYPCETTPNDAFFANLWGLNNTGQRVNFVDGTPDADIDAPEAWDLETGRSDVVIAIIDTGIDYRHADLANNIWVNGGEIPGNGIDDDGNGYTDDVRGWDFFDNDPDPMDPDGHGTHVAGIVGAEGNNGKGVSGVGWDIKVMALKVGGAAGFFTTTRLSAAIDYATVMGAKVINASWGGSVFDMVVRNAIESAGASGVLFVAAAGNKGENIDSIPFYPASYDLENIISVAATDQNDQLAPFSNFGAQSVDVGAPGTNILSTYIKRLDIWNDDFDDGTIDDWSHGGVKDSWGLSGNLSLSPPFSLTDSPGGDYENDTSAWIKRDIDLTGSSAVVLSGMIRGSSEEFADRLFVQTSRDDAIWTTRDTEIIFNSESSIGQSISGTMDDVWRFFRTDIGSIDGSSGHFRFLFQTNGANVDDGWYLDELRITISAGSTDTDLKYLQGTSMGTPLVSGLAALIWSHSPGQSASQVKEFILNGVDQKASLSASVLSGGRINAFNSIPPLPPSNLNATAISDSNIIVTWIDESQNEAGFKVERKFSGGTYVQVADIPVPNTVNYTDSNLFPGTTYFYRVRSYTPAGNSLYSAEVSDRTSGTTPIPPLPPSNLTAIAESEKVILITWKDNADNEAGFKVERRTESGSYVEVADIIIPDTESFSDGDLQPQTTYTYRVKAYNPTGDSPYSTEASAETLGIGSSGGGGCSITDNSTGNLTAIKWWIFPYLSFMIALIVQKRAKNKRK